MGIGREDEVVRLDVPYTLYSVLDEEETEIACRTYGQTLENDTSEWR